MGGDLANSTIESTMRLLAKVPLGRRFMARRLNRATVLWINSAWFDECEIENLATNDHEFRSRWLLSNFAFAVPSPSDEAEGAYGLEEKAFFSDSYGETGKVFHGGSARAGAADGFQVKGIGITPLLGRYADPLHSHGNAWFEEGVRESIYSEIYRRELPWSAVPVIALIDTGVHSRDHREGFERRVLIIRPFVFRPAHAQRASLFRPFDDVRGAQVADAQRTRLIVETLQSSPAALGAPIANGSFSPEILFRRIAEQIAYCEANRLTHGGFVASNLAFDARALDFGAARSLPSWAYVSLLPGLPGFGRDHEVVSELIESLSFYLAKYSPILRRATCSDLVGVFSRHLNFSRRREFMRLWGPGVLALDDSLQDGIYAKTMALFSIYQKSQVDVQSLNHVDRTWPDAIEQLIDAVLKLISAGQNNDSVGVGFDLAQHFRRRTAPRPGLFREVLQTRIRESICPSSRDGIPSPHDVQRFIRHAVDSNVLEPDAASYTFHRSGP